MIIKWFRF